MAFVNNLSYKTMYPFILLIIYLSMIVVDFLFAFNPSVLKQYWAGYLMAQTAVPVNEDRNELFNICAILGETLS